MYTILKNTHVHVYKISAQKKFQRKNTTWYVCKKTEFTKKIFFKKKFKFFSELGSKLSSLRKFLKTSEKKFFLSIIQI